MTEIWFPDHLRWDQYAPPSHPQEHLCGASLVRLPPRVFAALVAHPHIFHFYRECRKPRPVVRFQLWPFFTWERFVHVTDAEALAMALGVGRVELLAGDGRDAEAVMRSGQRVLFRGVIA